jgi:hypothetical protein
VNEYFLIDPPVNPFSAQIEILAWVEECRLKLSKNPKNKEWQAALLYAESLVAKK